MAYGFDEGKNKVTFADYFTYVIDSQAKFDDWVNGVSGNDYSYVAIIGGKGAGANGAYVQTKSNDLTGKTKGIQGFCGARIEANSDAPEIVGLRYDSCPTITDYFVRDLAVNVTGSGTNGCYSFFRCTNLSNCIGTSTSRGSSEACAFIECTNINNCTGIGVGYASSMFAPNAFGFLKCVNLGNCTGSSSGTSTGMLFGFYYCKRLSFCTATGRGAKYNNCYVTSTTNETYKIPTNGSDTPNGGFNV